MTLFESMSDPRNVNVILSGKSFVGLVPQCKDIDEYHIPLSREEYADFLFT